MAKRLTKEEKIKAFLENKAECIKKAQEFMTTFEERVITFTIEGKPENYVRERAGRGNHFYNPKGTKMKEYKNNMLHQMSKEDYEWTRELIKDENAKYELSISMLFFLPTPKADSVDTTIKKEMGLLVPMSRPDVDNFVKFILDSLHDVVYDDDSKVTDVYGAKRYSMNPRTIIECKIRKYK